MHTEQEAKQLWCPMARMTDGAHNRYVDFKGKETPEGNCIASQCAMWVWAEDVGVVDHRTGDRQRRGYCGLRR